jgi:uncharacterized membrane protein YfcA
MACPSLTGLMPSVTIAATTCSAILSAVFSAPSALAQHAVEALSGLQIGIGAADDRQDMAGMAEQRQRLQHARHGNTPSCSR